MERNVMGELSMYRQSGTKPNFSEIGRRHGMSRKTVSKYWRAGGDLDVLHENGRPEGRPLAIYQQQCA